MSLFFDISGLVFGALGIIGVFQFLYILLNSYLPQYRLATLENAFADAYALYRCGVEEGLLLQTEAKRIAEKLQRARIAINGLRNQVVCIDGLWQQIVAIFSRMSWKFSKVDRLVKDLRVDIASSSEKGRHQLEAGGRPYVPCILPLAAAVPPTSASWACCSVHAGYQGMHDVPASGFTPTSQHSSLDTSSTSDHYHGRTPQAIFVPAVNVPNHRDSVCTISTTATAVDIDSSQCISSPTHDGGGRTSTATPCCDISLPSIDASDSKLPHISTFVMEPEDDPAMMKTCSSTDLCHRVDILSSMVLSLQRQLQTQRIIIPEVDVTDGMDETSTSKTLRNFMHQKLGNGYVGPLLPS